MISCDIESRFEFGHDQRPDLTLNETVNLVTSHILHAPESLNIITGESLEKHEA